MRKGRLRQWVVSIICQLSVMVVSAAYCWLEPLTLRLAEDPELELDPDEISWLTSLIETGASLTPLLSGYLTNRVGRKYVIMSVSFFCFTGWVLVIISKTLLSLILVRILHGMAVGVAFTVSPIYTAEIAEPKLRGRLSGLFQTAWYLGMLYSFATGPYLDLDMYAYACLPLPILFVILWRYVPETPYYLLMTDRKEEAKKTLQYLRDGDVEEELENMRRAVMEEMLSTKGTWKTLFEDKLEVKALIIVQIVSIAKYMTGITVIMNYALELFARSNSSEPPEKLSIILAVVLTLVSFISAFLSDSIGRKPLLLVSCFGCFVALFLTSTYYFIFEKTIYDETSYDWALYVGLYSYCVFSDLGLGPLLQTLQSEMFGTKTRGVAGGITQGFVGIISPIAIKLFTPISDNYGVYLNFWIYSLIALVCGVLLSLLLKETAGKVIGYTPLTEDKSNSVE